MENIKRDRLIFMVAVVTIVLAVVFVPWRDIFELLSDIAENIWELFFWGLFLVIFAVLTPIFLIRHRRFTRFLKHWYRGLGVITLTLAIWGIFAFNGAGGTIGMAIIGGERDAWGVFRIILLFMLAIILLVPRVTDWLRHVKDALVSVMKSSAARQKAESLKAEELASGVKAPTPASAQPESTLKMKCMKCGNDLVGAPAFCVYCGARVEIEREYCPSCGAATHQSAVFCTKCGTRLLEV
jgi:hypothetical protein